jgi:transposase
MAAEELAELHRLDGRLKAMKSELKAAVEQLGSHLMNIHGIGPAGAARILADVLGTVWTILYLLARYLASGLY